MNKIFKCPKCGCEVNKDKHYKSILQSQNLVSLLMGNNKEIINSCPNCNYMEFKEEDK